jgi:D-sedoheptulose 7-phosphate isomerase
LDRTVIAPAARGFRELLADRRGLLDADRYETVVERIAQTLTHAFRTGHKVLWCGNGGSAADAQHLAAEFSGRFLRERRALSSEALSVNSSAVTAIANDYGFDRVFARQVEAFALPGDVVVGISTSGNSRNIVLALEAARRGGASTIAFSGNGGGEIAALADIALIGPDGYSALVQEVHITLGHIVCHLVEQSLFPAAR